MTEPHRLLAHVNLAPGFRGGERQTQLLLAGLAERGWRQRLVARRGGELAGRCGGIPGLEVVMVANNVLSAARALRGSALVHVHEGRALQAAGLHRLLGGAPYLVTRRVQKGPRPGPVNRLLYRRAVAVVAVSAAIRSALHTLAADLDVSVVPDATSELAADPEAAAAIRAACGGTVLVGNVAALVDAHKGQLQIIEVARRLAAHAELQFLLVGGGPDEARLRAASAGLANVHFAGHVDRVGDYLAALDIFFYPSRHEGLGSVLLDAMAFGLPVVATRVGGIPEIVTDPDNGRLCAVDDCAAQAQALLQLAGDAALRARIGTANRARAGGYSPAAMTSRYVALYEALLGRSGGERRNS